MSKNGFHSGQNDNPTEILEKYLEKYPEGKFIFRLDGTGQFDINFSIYKKIEKQVDPFLKFAEGYSKNIKNWEK